MIVNMRQILMILMAMLFTCCSSDSEVKAEPASVQNAGKTLVVYYSYTGNCREIVNSLTTQNLLSNAESNICKYNSMIVNDIT